MANRIQYFKLPTVIVASMASMNNVLMIIVIQRTTRLQGPMKTWVANLGCVNALLSSLISVQTFISMFPGEQRNLSDTRKAVLFSFGSFLTILQLASQLCISIERMVAVRMPFKYRSRYANSSRKMLALAVWLASVVIGAAIGSLAVKLHFPILISISTWVFFTAVLITQALLYLFSIRMVRATSKAVNEVMEIGRDQPPNVSNRDFPRRQHEKRLHQLAAGIIISYTCCNFPLMVFVAIYDVAIGSNSSYNKKGAFYTASIALVALNLLIDPLWYFFYNYVLTK